MGADSFSFFKPGLLRLLEARSTCSCDDHKCPQTLPSVLWGQDCPGRELLDPMIWLMFWVLFLCQVHQEAGTHLEGTCPRWGERHSFIHSLIRSICQCTSAVTISLPGTGAKELRDMSPLPGAAVQQRWPCDQTVTGQGVSGSEPSMRDTGRLPGGGDPQADWKASQGQPDGESQGPAKEESGTVHCEGVLAQGQHHTALTPVARWACGPLQQSISVA